MYFSKLKTCVNCQAKRETNNIWLYHPSKLTDYQDSFSMYLFKISNCICQKRVGGHLTLRCLRLDWLLTHQGFPTHLAQYWTTCNCSPTVQAFIFLRCKHTLWIPKKLLWNVYKSHCVVIKSIYCVVHFCAICTPQCVVFGRIAWTHTCEHDMNSLTKWEPTVSPHNNYSGHPATQDPYNFRSQTII